MIPLRDALGADDFRHLRSILGHSPEEDLAGTRRRTRVDQLATGATYVDPGSVEAFQSLLQPDRERLLSDVVWNLTCFVEGSITQISGVNSCALECGFNLVQSEQGGREVFCLVKK